MAVQSFVEFDNTGGGLTQSSFSLGVIGTNYLLRSHIKVHLGLDILAETSDQLLVDRDGGAPGSGKHYEWTNDTTIRLIDASGNAQNLASGKKLTIIRETPDSSQLVPWTDGSNLNAEALNNADKQNLFVVQEQQDKNKLSSTESRAAKTASDTATSNVATLTSTQFRSDGSAAMTGDLDVGNNKIENLADPTAAQDAVTKAFLERTGSITTQQIEDGTIVNADINSGAEIAVSKLADGTARQLLQTDTGGSAVEWTSNVDIPGTLDVTGAGKFDGTLNVVGAVDFDSNLNVDGSLVVDGTSTLTGNVTVSGTVDGRDLATDGTKLDGIEAGATGDQTASQIKTLYESNANTEAFTTTEQTKLSGIETSAKDDQTAAEIKTLLAASKLTSDHLDTDSVTTAQIADNELSVLAGMQGGTASKLAAAQTLTADINDLNQIDGLTKQSGTGLTDTDSSFPTSKAVVNFVADQIAPIGGLEVIANDQSFPNTQPASGVVISIADAGGLVVASGSSTTGRTVGGTQVEINNIASNFNGKTVDAGVAFMVSSTGTGHVYNYHKATLKEADLLNLSNDIDDFGNRYRVLTTLPAANDASNDDGDLVWVTSTAKMMVYSGSPTGSPVGAFEEVQSVGNFFISSLSPAFDNSTIDFTVTNAPTSAEQIILSINGVIQKPNAGTSRPSEGFSLNGSTIQLPTGTQIPANTPHFVVVIGSTVNIGTPSDNTVDEDILQSGCVTNAKVKADAAIAYSKLAALTDGNILVGNGSNVATSVNPSGDIDISNAGVFSIASGAIVNADVNASAAIAGTKIDPDFGSQNIVTTGDIELPDDSQIAFGATQDLELLHSGNTSIIRHVTAGQDLNLQSARNIILSDVGASTEFARIDSNGNVGIGTISPDNTLHLLYSDSQTYNTDIRNAGLQIENNDGTDNTYAQLHLRAGNSDAYLRAIREGSNLTSLAFLTDNGGSTGDAGEAMRIDSNGRVIIGHTTSIGQDRIVQVIGTTADTSAIEVIRHSADASAPKIDLTKSRNATKGSNTIVNDGDGLGQIVFRADDGTDFTTPAATILAAVDGTPGANDMPGRLIFSTTADGANNVTERFRLTSAGQLLYGNSSARTVKDLATDNQVPTWQFESANTDSKKDILLMYGRNNSNGADLIFGKHRDASVNGTTIVQDGDRCGAITFTGSDGSTFRPAAGVQGVISGSPGANDIGGELRFVTAPGGGAAPLTRIAISKNGNVKWKAHSSSNHVWTRKAFGDVSLSAGASMDIRLSEGFTNNTCIRCEYAFNWNDGNGGAWGTVIIWKHHDANHDVRFLAEEIASPADSVSIIKNGNNLDLRLTMESGGGMNGRFMISVDHSSPNEPNAF